MPFCRTGFQINLFDCCWKHITADFDFFVLSTLANITKFPIVVLGPRPMTLIAWLNKTLQNKKRRPLFLSSLYMSTSSLYLIPQIHTEFSVIITFWPCGRLEGDCCLKPGLKSLKEKHIILYSQHLLKKSIALLHQEYKKNAQNILKITLSCGNYNAFFVLLTIFIWLTALGTY